MDSFFTFINVIVVLVPVLIVMYFLSKTDSLKEQIKDINEENDYLKKQITIENEIEEQTKNISDVDYATNSDRMRNKSL